MQSIVSSETRDPDNMTRSFALLRITCVRFLASAFAEASVCVKTSTHKSADKSLEMTEEAVA